jgi:Flp pilus assembly protein TadD
VDAITAALEARFPPSSELGRAARLNLARLLTVAGQPQQALYVLDALDTRPAAALRARAHFVAGDFAAAEGLAQLLLQQDGSDRSSLTLLAEIALARGQPGGARDWLHRALAVDPYDPEARAALARLEQVTR